MSSVNRIFNPFQHMLNNLESLEKSLLNQNVLPYREFDSICGNLPQSGQYGFFKKSQNMSFRYNGMLVAVFKILTAFSDWIGPLKIPEIFEDQVLYACCISLLEKLQNQVREEQACFGSDKEAYEIYEDTHFKILIHGDGSKAGSASNGLVLSTLP